MKILGVDPGPSESAIVLWDTTTELIICKGHHLNDYLLPQLRHGGIIRPLFDYIVVEDISFQNKKVGGETFSTAKFIGRIQEAMHPSETWLIRRSSVTNHFCRFGGGDSGIKKALKEKYPVESKRVKGHEWSAWAVALFFAEMTLKGKI